VALAVSSVAAVVVIIADAELFIVSAEVNNKSTVSFVVAPGC
jgi:hypothetical protein